MIGLSIIVATYNRSAYLLRTLDSLARQTLSPERFEIVVVDNNSTDDTPAVCEAFAEAHPELRLRRVMEPSQGISFARNRGIAESRGACIVFIDDDEEAGVRWAESYFRFFDEHPGFDAAGGAVVPVYEAPLPRWYSHYIEKMITGVMDMGPRIVPFRGKRYPGVGNSGFRRSLFDRFGNFDTALGRSGTNPMGGEEKDFAARLRAGGVRYYYIPDAEIYRRQRARPHAQRGEGVVRPAAVRRGGQVGRHAGALGGLSAAVAAAEGPLSAPHATEHHVRPAHGPMSGTLQYAWACHTER